MQWAGPSVPWQPETPPRSGPLSHLLGVNVTEGRSCQAPGSLHSTARTARLASISLIHCSLSDEGTVSGTARTPRLASISLIHCSLSDEGTVSSTAGTAHLARFPHTLLPDEGTVICVSWC